MNAKCLDFIIIEFPYLVDNTVKELMAIFATFWSILAALFLPAFAIFIDTITEVCF